LTLGDFFVNFTVSVFVINPKARFNRHTP
jgi:hypothetical protein